MTDVATEPKPKNEKTQIVILGGERDYTDTCSQNYKFTSKQRDPESGLDNFRARYIASAFRRFISPDPMGGDITDPQTLNRYVYVRDNPLNLIDPSGLEPQSAQNCIYSIYSGGTATDCYPSSAGEDQIEQNQGQGQNPTPPLPFVPADCGPPQCKFIQVHVDQKAPDGCDTSDAACRQQLKQLYPQGGQVSPQKTPKNNNPPQTAKTQRQLKLHRASKAALRDLLIGQAVGTGVGCGIGGLVAAGGTAATATFPLAEATIPAGCVGGGAIGFFEALPYSMGASIVDFSLTYFGH